MFLLLSTIFLINFLCINSCPSGSSKGPNGNCYKVINSEDQGNPDWFGAENLCRKDGGHLASISDSFTNSFIANLARTALGDSRYWIGAVRTMQWWNNTLPWNQTWTWLDSKDFQYTNWNKSMQVQPSQDIQYLCLTQDSVTGVWNPVQCSYYYYLSYACEYTNSTQDLCPEDDLNYLIKWTHLTAFGGKCYGLVYPSPHTIYGNISWFDALNYCSNFSSNSNQASLVSIHSDLENAIVATYMSYDTDYYYDAFWIGLEIPSYNITNITWTDGTLVEFTYWDSQQFWNSQNYLNPGLCTEYIMSFHSGNRWELNYCNSDLAAFVCEYWDLK